jgi:ribosomal protein S27E
MQNTPPAKTAQSQPQQITTKCPTCKNSSIAITDIESGEIICSKCGIVLKVYIYPS